MIIVMNLIALISIIIITLLFYLITSLKKKSQLNLLKSSAFECGFQQITPPSTSISIPFFLITLIFLIFDIEISIMFPLLDISSSFMNLNLISNSFFMFFIILIIGLLIEWKNSAIKWLKL
uniref:NADH-ubiquinone oxidoreductase chain 3 n=1 Tax=Dendrocerus sp. ZJUH_2016009 TaxID=2491154 RepID=A0A3Q8U9X6_9HYME|nr:NADH dehydrogenase subunit 3 [Dendrocerus sp. ZJUH_2016009]